MYDIKVNVDSLAALLLAQKEKAANFDKNIKERSAAFEQEMQDKRSAWKKDQEDFELAIK